MQTVASALAGSLHNAGIDTIFGLPGGETVEFLDAIRRRDIRFILTHHETAAVFMADAWSRVTGRPGVCLTTLGPGAANAVAGLSHAYLDRSPILIITAQKPDTLLPAYTHQVLDLHALYRPITKASIKLDAGNVLPAAQYALHLVQSERPGPVHLQLSNEDAGEPVAENPPPAVKPSQPAASTTTAAAIDRARSILARAHRPLILAGLGLEPERPYAALHALAEAARAPVAVTPKAKGALPDNHALSAGTVGLTRTDPIYTLIDEADCLIAVGFDVVELVKPWKHPAPLIWAATWPNHDPVISAAVEIVGSLPDALTALAQGPFNVAPDWGSARVASFHNATRPQPLPEPAPGRLLPQTVLAALRRYAPADAFLAVDVGSHKIFSSLQWPAFMSNRFLVSNGLSCMGYALPAAIGAALAAPGTHALCLTGDAGLAMTLGELGVLSRCDLPVTVIVLNDGAIDLIRSHQRRVGKPVYATEFAPPDFTHIAKAFGLPAQRVSDEAQLEAALQDQLARTRPALIEVMLDPASYPTTPS